ISHDLGLVARLADRIAVMSRGQIVEIGAAQQIIHSPTHQETKKLLASVQIAASNLNRLTGASA
ncbi:MAG: ABC transporter ATP-binding protein, partial [Methylocella sp.]